MTPTLPAFFFLWMPRSLTLGGSTRAPFCGLHCCSAVCTRRLILYEQQAGLPLARLLSFRESYLYVVTRERTARIQALGEATWVKRLTGETHHQSTHRVQAPLARRCGWCRGVSNHVHQAGKCYSLVFGPWQVCGKSVSDTIWAATYRPCAQSTPSLLNHHVVLRSRKNLIELHRRRKGED